MDSLVRSFLLSRQADGCTVKTLRWHETALTCFYDWLSGEGHGTDPEEWDTNLLRAYVLYLQTKQTHKGTTLSGTSVTTYVQSLKAYTRWLYLEEITSRDVAGRLRKPRVPDTQKQPYSNDELKRMLAVVKDNPRDYAIITLLIDCGLRASELCNLKVTDANTAQGLLIVRQGKGRKDRVVPMSPKTIRVVRKFAATRPPDGYMFSTVKRDCFTAGSLLQLIQRVGKAAKVPNANVHRFRHTFALAWLRNDGDVMTLQKVMGHSNLSTTQVYLSLTTEDLQRGHATASPLSNLSRR